MAEQRGRRALGLVTTLVWAPPDETQWIPGAKVTPLRIFLNFSSLSQTKKNITVNNEAADEHLTCCSVYFG